MRPWSCLPGRGQRDPGSRARGLRTCRGSKDDAGWRGSLRCRTRACCLLLATTASAPRTALLSPLNTSPIRAPVNASPLASQPGAHDSGPVWIATPSLQRTCTVYSLPVSRRTNRKSVIEQTIAELGKYRNLDEGHSCVVLDERSLIEDSAHYLIYGSELICA